MQFHQFNRRRKELLLTLLALVTSWVTIAQVSTVEFGKNRVQYRKFKWQYLQTPNFNTYFYFR